MAVKISVIAAVAVLETVDMTGVMMAFPAEFEHDSQKVEFDVYEAGREIALKGSFAAQANVVGKDGFKTITVNPMQINESIVDSVANLNKKRVGETVYGDKKGISAGLQRTIEDEIKGFGKLKKRSQRLVKKSGYDVLTTGKVVVSANGVVTDEIDYGLTNIVVNDNATAGQYQWNDTTNSNPIQQLEKYSLGMGKFAVDTFILGFEAHKAFIAHPKVQTTDNTTTGKKANFRNATIEEARSKGTDTLIFVGTTTGDYGRVLEIYVELDQYNDGSTDVYYMNKNYAVGFKRGNEDNGQIHYGNIPATVGDGENALLTTVVGREWMDGEIMKNPAGVARYYRSSPLPTMNQPKAYVSIKATLIA